MKTPSLAVNEAKLLLLTERISKAKDKIVHWEKEQANLIEFIRLQKQREFEQPSLAGV